jgi:hypothetical protein
MLSLRNADHFKIGDSFFLIGPYLKIDFPQRIPLSALSFLFKRAGYQVLKQKNIPQLTFFHTIR